MSKKFQKYYNCAKMSFLRKSAQNKELPEQGNREKLTTFVAATLSKIHVKKYQTKNSNILFNITFNNKLGLILCVIISIIFTCNDFQDP